MVNMLCPQRVFLVSLLLPLVVSAQSRYMNTSISPCTSCTVTATELFLTYPSPVTSTTVSVTVSKIPYVTIHTDGSSETNYRTVTQSLNVTETFTGTGSVDPHASLTWEVDGVLLTYPTTYVSMFGFSGGLFTPTTELSQPTCSPHVEPLQLPSDSASGVIAAVTVPLDLATPIAISAPAPIIQYLNGIPAVQTQFSKSDLARCSWTNKVVSKTTAKTSQALETNPTATEAFSTAIPVQKVSVTVLTEVTGKQVIITAPGDSSPHSDIKATPAVAHIESIGTVLNAPPTAAAQNSPQGPHQTAGSTAAGAAAIIGLLGLPTPSSNGGSSNGGAGGISGSGSISLGDQQVAVSAVSGGAVVVGGQTVQPGQVATINGAAVSVPASGAGQGSAPSAVVVNGVTQAVAPAATPGGSINIAGQQVAVQPVSTGAVVIAGQTIQAGQVATLNGATISVPAAGSGDAATAVVVNGITQEVAPGLATGSPVVPTALVLTINGVATTIAPTIISGPTGSVTAFVLGPGTTVVEGGSALTLPFTTLSLPAPSQTSRGNGASTSTTASDEVGGAIASGIGIVPPATTTGLAKKGSIDSFLLLAGIVSAFFGALAVWL